MPDQEMLAAIASGPPTWTVCYAAQARVLGVMAAGVAFRALADAPLAMPTMLAVRPTSRGFASDALLAACRAIA
jgi:hypothetical protein